MFHALLLCLAMNVYFEARGEPDSGQQAVAHVTLNRARENADSVCSEVYKRNQFSWTRHIRRVPLNKDPAWIRAQSNAKKALHSPDNTKRCLFLSLQKK